MKSRAVIWVGVGVIAGWIAFGGGAGAIAQSVTGVWDSHVVQESYRISVGVDALDKPRKDEKVDEIRTHYNLPRHYGNLIGVTGQGDGAAFWFQDEQGIIRNAIVPAGRLSRIEYTDTSRYEEDILP